MFLVLLLMNVDVAATVRVMGKGVFVMLAGTVAILLWMDWQLALASFAVVPVLMYVTMKVRFKVRAAYTTMISRRSPPSASAPRSTASS